MNYTSLNDFAEKKYNKKLYRLSLDGGFTCPNRDGVLGTKGCIFCNGAGSGGFTGDLSERQHTDTNAGSHAIKRSILSINEQIELQKQLLTPKLPKTKAVGYIAYFQSFTGTYANVSKLRDIYLPVADRKDIDIISIATRPDCLSEDILIFLAQLNKIKPVWIELGLQTIHPETAKYIRRGYNLNVYDTAVQSLAKIGIEQIITHVILGLPGETKEMMLETVRHIVSTESNGIKFQLLHVLKNTDLASDYEKNKFSVLSLEEYTDVLKSCISLLPEDMVVHRITGDGDKRELIAPLWSANKKLVLNHLNKELGK